MRAYGVSNAHAGFQDAGAGTLEAGKLADFVVLSHDIFAIDPAEIGAVRVMKTIVGGKVRFEAR